MSDAALTYMTLAIMAFALVWRIAVRPRVVRWSAMEAKPHSGSKQAIIAYFGLGICEIAAAIAILLIWPRFAWAALLVIVVGQEIRFWAFSFLVAKCRPTNC